MAQSRIRTAALWLCLSLVLLYAVLLVPDADDALVHKASGTPFLWNRDSTWKQLEAVYRQARALDSAALDARIDSLARSADTRLALLRDTALPPEHRIWGDVGSAFFALAPLVAASQRHTNWYIDYYRRARIAVKQHSTYWDMNSLEARRALYTLLYGMRSALEEVLLVGGSPSFPPVLHVSNEPSMCPSAVLKGITVHSGDLLVSRGGAEVSALISRGNDYPGNFSHVALLYVDSATRTPYFVEAHIEKGVAVATAGEYIADKKLRFMVMRPRADLRQMRDPLLPHKAAEYMYRKALEKHIPYDFKMQFHDPSAMFCSEVGSYAYRRYGVHLWQGVSTISSPGIVSWLHVFGVENFVTQMPSDLEYDPQLSVVAEWRDAETLLKDHIDNAVMDVLLERADQGKRIEYSLWQLPFVRIIKAYCMVVNLFGKPAVIPEGMSATRALKNNTFVAMHTTLKEHTEKAVANFIHAHGYTPPYWQIVALAKQQQ